MEKILTFTLLIFWFVSTVNAQPSYNIFLKQSANQIQIYLHPTQPISTLAFKLTASPGLDIVGDQITPSPTFTTDPWIIPFKKVVRKDNQVWIEFAAVTLAKSGWSATSDTLLATFSAVPTTHNPPPTLTFDPALTAIMSRGSTANLASFPTPALTFSVTKPNFFLSIWRTICAKFHLC